MSGEATCTRCVLHHTRTQVVVGRGHDRASVMFIGEAPGRHEDTSGQGFQGAAGRVFDRMLAYVGLAREDIWLANAVRCRPSVGGQRNRAPRPEEIEACRDWLLRDLERVRPRVVVTLGRVAFESVSGEKWREDRRAVPMPVATGRTAFPLYHPAYLIYRPHLKPVYGEDLMTLRQLLVGLGVALHPSSGVWL